MIRSMSFGSFQLTRHSKVYENPAMFNVSKIDQNDTIDLSLWYDCEVSEGLSKKETDDVINEFYAKLAQKYLDLPIWSNLDREHLFLYIAHYKKSINKVADLSGLIKAVQRRKNREKKSSRKKSLHPVLNEGSLSVLQFQPCTNNPFRACRKNAGKYSKRKSKCFI